MLIEVRYPVTSAALMIPVGMPWLSHNARIPLNGSFRKLWEVADYWCTWVSGLLKIGTGAGSTMIFAPTAVGEVKDRNNVFWPSGLRTTPASG